MFRLAQVGDGTASRNRITPVSVAGLSSGVAMVALGSVRSGYHLFACLILARERVCGLCSFVWCNCDMEGCVREGLIAGGAEEGSLSRDACFAVAFLCGVEQWRAVVLGRQRLRTSDALRCLLLMGLLLCAGGGAFGADGGCFHSRRSATAPRRTYTRPCLL